MSESYWPEVVQAVAGPESTVYAYFSDGTVRLYDAKPLIARGGVFAPLRDPNLFASALTVVNGTVAWDLEGTRDPASVLDVDPFTVYAAAVAADPLDDAA
jgi:hypothetical protein